VKKGYRRRLMGGEKKRKIVHIGFQMRKRGGGKKDPVRHEILERKNSAVLLPACSEEKKKKV